MGGLEREVRRADWDSDRAGRVGVGVWGVPGVGVVAVLTRRVIGSVNDR